MMKEDHKKKVWVYLENSGGRLRDLVDRHVHAAPSNENKSWNISFIPNYR
jgi:hypothetical protein